MIASCRVKICGVTSGEQARLVAGLGADAVGVNFVPGSPRRVSEEIARDVVRAVGGQVLVVGVVSDLPANELLGLRERTGVACLQVHGDGAFAAVEALLPHAYAGVRIGGAEDVAFAARAPGDYVLVDAKVEGALGGTGRTFDWDLVVPLARVRRLVLAGGLRPENVGEAVSRVHPYCVDVASGVESAPGAKDPRLVRTFVEAVHGALRG